MSNIATCKKPPDGGYGWVITFAYALNNVFVLPLITNFGLVLQGATAENALSRTQVTFVIILNHSIGMLLSLFGGPVLSRYGYRKVAIIGAIFISSSLILTFFANQFWQFLLWYSILCSMGISAIMAAFTLAINSFFDKNRAKAIGISMSITGLGTILMPKLMSSLIYTYGWRYTVLTLGAICLHSLLAACLLRPAKWYLKEEEKPLFKEREPELVNGSALSSSSTGSPSLPQLQSSIEKGKLPSKSMSMRPLSSNSTAETRNAISHPDISAKSQEMPLSEARYKWWGSLEINLNSSINIFEEPTNTQKVQPEKKEKKGYWASLVEFFDLTLLSDPVFVNIIFGISLAGSVETNFSVLLPIILSDMLKLDITDQSTIMSVIGLTDTLFRFVSPFIGEWCNKSPRVMYIASLFMIIFTRTMMLFTTSFTGMLFVSLALGITKALRTLCVNLVMPNYIPIHRLAFASGIQMFFNGIAIFIVTFFLTRIREASGSYILPIIMLNIVTLITVISWGAEFTYYRLKNKTNTEQQASLN